MDSDNTAPLADQDVPPVTEQQPPEPEPEPVTAEVPNIQTIPGPSAPVPSPPPALAPGESGLVGALKQKESFWASKLFKAIVVVSFIVGVGLVALVLFFVVKWSSVVTTSNDVKAEWKALWEKWEIANKTIQGLDANIKVLQTEIDQLQATLKDLRTRNETLTANYSQLVNLNQTIREDIKVVTEEIDKYTKENAELHAHNEQMKEQIKHIHTQIADAQQHLKALGTEEPVYQITAAVIGGVFVLGMVDNVIAHVELSALEAEMVKQEHMVHGFSKVATGFENYEAYHWHKGRTITRQYCFEGIAGLQYPVSCVDKSPTITSIKTRNGFRFGGTLFVPWPPMKQNKDDSKAFMFSVTHAEVAKLKPGEHVAISGNEDGSFEFGRKDVYVNPPHGTVDEQAFSIPLPYNKTTFYVDGNNFDIEQIRISYLTLA